MKVLVLGGTGAMGVHLIQLLSDNGIETFVTTRDNKESKKNVKFLQGNALQIEFLQSVLQEKWDAIVDFMVYTTASFNERVNLLLDATSQYVFLSSSRVYADSDQPITEISPRLLDISQDKEFLATDEYSLTKARQEDLLRNTCRKNWTIIRPYITYSANRFQLGVFEKEEWLYRALHGRSIVFSKEILSKKVTMTYGLDVSIALLKLIGNSNALGEIFNITTQETYSWSGILNVYLEVLEKHLGKKINVLMLDLDKVLECKPVKYQILYDRLFNRQFDNRKTSMYVNISNFTTLDLGLKKCMENFLENPQFDLIDWKLEALKDRQTNEYTTSKEIKGIKHKVKYFIFRYLY